MKTAMRTVIIITVISLLFFSFAACESPENPGAESKDTASVSSDVSSPESAAESKDTASASSDVSSPESIDETSDIKKTYISADWPKYKTVEELAGRATSIYEGVITDISFVVITPGGEVVTEALKEPDSSIYLNTVYEVEVTQPYKNADAEKMYFCVDFGKEGYMENKQVELQKSLNVYRESVGIPIINRFPDINIGETYIFFTHYISGPYDVIPNQYQFAFSAEKKFEHQNFTYDEVKKYLMNYPK